MQAVLFWIPMEEDFIRSKDEWSVVVQRHELKNITWIEIVKTQNQGLREHSCLSCTTHLSDLRTLICKKQPVFCQGGSFVVYCRIESKESP